MMSRKRILPSHPFKEMDAEAIASTVESDIKSLARKWKYAHSKSSRAAQETAAIETAALYLQANHDLYFRDERQALKDAHQHWILLMQEWFLSVFETKSRKKLK